MFLIAVAYLPVGQPLYMYALLALKIPAERARSLTNNAMFYYVTAEDAINAMHRNGKAGEAIRFRKSLHTNRLHAPPCNAIMLPASWCTLFGEYEPRYVRSR